MAFVSMNEVLKTKLNSRNQGRRASYDLLAISKSSINEQRLSYKSVIHIKMTPLLLKKTGFKDGDKVDFQFDYKNREGIICLSATGGRHISGGFVKGMFHPDKVRSVQFPYFAGFGFPLSKVGILGIPDNQIHLSNLRIIFELKGMDDKFIYELSDGNHSK